MTKRLTLLLCLLLCISCAGADSQRGKAVSSLHVDLEAVAEAGAVKPVDGITSAGQPNEAQFKVFAANGYTTVIDIRTAGEDRGLDEPALVEALGMEYVTLPIGRDDITIEKARQLDALLQGREGPVLVHCGSGNRVGALLALKTFDETGDAELVLEKGRAGGLTRLEGQVKEVMGVGAKGE